MRISSQGREDILTFRCVRSEVDADTKFHTQFALVADVG